MRVLKNLGISLLILAVVGGIGFLIMREILLLITISRVKKSLTQVRSVDTKQTYLTECMSRGSSRDDKGKAHSTQLRFLDKGNYIVEVVCNQMEYNPIELERGQLPSAVVPQPGQSGIRWGLDAGLNFISFNRVASVSIIDRMIVTSLKPTVVASHQGPPSDCLSYGYQCCDQDTQIGTGDKITDALDCPQSCYEICSERPLILSFTTQPYYDRITRTLQVSASEPVVFSYLVTPNQSFDLSYVTYGESDDLVENIIAMIDTIFTRQPEDEQVQVFLDFGDGNVEEFAGLRGQTEHQYDCASNSCLYHAKLRVQKEDGIESLESPQSTIKVQVQDV
jgi:hypothetical protein